MADTLPISTGSFVLPKATAGVQTLVGTTTEVNGVKLDVVSAANPSGNPVALSGVTYTTNSDSLNKPANILLTGDNNNVITKSSIILGNADDTLIIASSKSTGGSTASQFIATDSNFELGDGNNKLTFSGGVRNISVTSGNANDRIEIKGDAQSSNFKLGDGADTLIFGGNIKTNTVVDLGSDNKIDTINVASGQSFSGLSITGASQGDILVIGDKATYSYQESSDNWVNVNDPKDKLKF